uniref:M96 mating-specific protein family n=1 Tax=Globisporangium ultimum (strain ATCC 200006 / CBS 805.95 / DAOM BR144) TaxID=431595 RepID=K3W903_GLOUD
MELLLETKSVELDALLADGVWGSERAEGAAAVSVHVADNESALFSMDDALLLLDDSNPFDGNEVVKGGSLEFFSDLITQSSASAQTVAVSTAPVVPRNMLSPLQRHETVKGSMNTSTAVPGPTSTSVIVRLQREIPAKAPTSTEEGINQNSKSNAKPVKSTVGKKRRNVVKDELEYLRQQVKELEHQLEQLSQTSASSSDESDMSFSWSSMVMSNIWTQPRDAELSESLWKRIAARQLDEREKAEIENAKLRELYESQLEIARSLERTLSKRPNVAWFDISPLREVQVDCCQFHSIRAGDSAFDTLLQRVDSMVTQIDVVLRDSGFAFTKDKEIRDIQTKTDAQDRIFLEVLDSIVLPFSLRTTSAAVWKLVNDKTNQVNQSVFQAIDSTSDTICAEFSIPMKLSQHNVRFRMRLLGKQIIEENRVAVIWCVMGDSEDGSTLAGSERVHLMREGWTVFEETPLSKLKDEASRSTVLQTIVRMSTEVSDSPSSSPPGSSTSSSSEKDENHFFGLLTDFMFDSLPHKLTMVYQMLEDLLVKDAVECTKA